MSELLPLPPGCEARCPACAYRELSSTDSRDRKEIFLRAELADWSSALRPLLEPSARWGYRRKALLHVRTEAGAWRLGMILRRGREEELIPIPTCPAHGGGVNELFAFAAARVPGDWPWAFALVSGRALTLVLKGTRREDWAAELRTWAAEFPRDASLFVNWNPGAGRRPLDSRRTELLLGEPWLRDQELWHGPVAFRQQLPDLSAAAVELGKSYLQAAGTGRVADLYCGLGASLAGWEALGWSAVGVELSGESLAAAARNAPGATLLRGRVEDRLPQVSDFIDDRPFVLYTNPPRTGQGEAVNRWALDAAPARIAYLSCNPRTLARDLRTLGERYEVDAIQPFDFFPPTPHVEALALLKRKT